MHAWRCPALSCRVGVKSMQVLMESLQLLDGSCVLSQGPTH